MPNRADRDTHAQPAEDTKPAVEPKEMPKLKVEEPKKMQRSLRSHSLSTEKSKKPYIIGGAVFVAVVVAALGVWSLLSNPAGTSGIDGGKYQAVFFTNGQVYFGKLQDFNDEYMKLTNVFYLQSAATEETDAKNPQATADDESKSPTLIKLGDEIHGPQDEMVISRDQVLFFENLKSDGKVSASIEKYQESKK